MLFFKKKYSEIMKIAERPKYMEKYKKQRNYVKKLKKRSVNAYIQERCVVGAKIGIVWKTITPYLSRKNISLESRIFV